MTRKVKEIECIYSPDCFVCPLPDCKVQAKYVINTNMIDIDHVKQRNHERKTKK